MSLDATKTVRELAVEMPNATRVFERLKIDYCCGGRVPLTEACLNAGVEIGEVERLLVENETRAEVGDTSTDVRAMRLAELSNYIVNKHHTFTRSEAERLTALITKVCAAHGQNHPELLRVGTTFLTLRAELEQHMWKEENVLFPYIARMEDALVNNRPAPVPPFGTVRNPVAVMSREHDAAGDLLREMRSLSANYTVPEDACVSYRTLYSALAAYEEDLHQHIHLENNILFPRALEIENAELSASAVELGCKH